MKKKDIDRFWSYIDKSGECWIWTGPKVGIGYGKICINYKHLRAHRVSWELTHGPIPADLCVLHKCDNPACVRPDHLWLGTYADNNKDMVRKGRSAKGKRNGRVKHPDRYPAGDQHYSRQEPERLARGESHGNAKLTEADVRQIRQDSETGITHRQLAARHNVSVYAIYSVIKRKTWAHI